MYQVLLLILEEIIPIWWDQGFFKAICADPSWTPVSTSGIAIYYGRSHSYARQRLEFYYMINYSFKYIELIDTVFLALKKKPLRKCGAVVVRKLFAEPIAF